jgi:dynein intermediate chain 1
MSIYAIRVNPFAPQYYLTASADWFVKLWKTGSDKHIMSFDIGSAINDLVWSPHSATTFCLVTSMGSCHIWDISVEKQKPMCDQQITKRSELVCVTYNQKEPVICIGDANGVTHCLKLSPNLRKKTEDESERIQKVVDQVMGVSSLDIS